MGSEEEVVVGGVFPVDDGDVFRDFFAVVVAVGDCYSSFEEVVNFAVGVGEGEGVSVADQLFDGEVNCWFGEVRVEFFGSPELMVITLSNHRSKLIGGS